MKHLFLTFSRLALLPLAVFAAPAAAQPDSPFGNPKGSPGPPEVHISAEISQSTAAPGDTLILAVILDHNPGSHTNLNEPVVPKEMEGFIPVSTEVSLNLPEQFERGPIQWPTPHAAKVDFMMTGNPIDYLVFDGTAVIFIPLRVSQNAATGPIEIPVTLSYQTCDDTQCLMPASESMTLSVEIVPTGTASESISGTPTDLFDGFDSAVFDDASAWTGNAATSTPDDAAGPDQSSKAEPISDRSASGSLFGVSIGSGLIPLALLSFIGGAILNLTPCVLPMIPLKIMTLTQHAGEDRRRALVLGLAMFAGVTAFWAALGFPVMMISSFADPSRLFAYWYVTVPVGLVIILLSMGMMGLFSITLPQATYKFSPRADNVFGSFLFGVLTATFGLPCFGFVAGALIPAAISLGDTAVMTIFTAMGLGMGAPYLVLAVFPKLVDRVPRTGPASELVKQVLGLLMGGFGMFFLGTGIRALVKTYPYVSESLHIYGLALLILAAGFWLAYQTFKITPSPMKRGFFGLIGVAFAALALNISVGSTMSHRTEYLERRAELALAGGDPGAILKTVWNEYTPVKLERALRENMVVFVDFTADWCINCKVFEAQVLNKEPVRSLLRSDEVAMIKVDLSVSNPDGEKLLEELERTGIPTWAVMGPGLDKPRIITTYTPQAVRDAIEAARGDAETVSP